VTFFSAFVVSLSSFQFSWLAVFSVVLGGFPVKSGNYWRFPWFPAAFVVFNGGFCVLRPLLWCLSVVFCAPTTLCDWFSSLSANPTPFQPVQYLLWLIQRIFVWFNVFSDQFRAYSDQFSGFLSDSKHILTSSEHIQTGLYTRKSPFKIINNTSKRTHNRKISPHNSQSSLPPAYTH
jgi:hypothetical protein